MPSPATRLVLFLRVNFKKFELVRAERLKVIMLLAMGSIVIPKEY